MLWLPGFSAAFLFCTRLEKTFCLSVDTMVLLQGKSPASSSIVCRAKYTPSQHVHEAVLLGGLPSCVAKFVACLFATFCSKRAYVHACTAHWVPFHPAVQDIAAAAMLDRIYVTTQHYSESHIHHHTVISLLYCSRS